MTPVLIIILLVTIDPAFTGYSRGQPPKPSPEFDDASTPTEIYAVVGQPVQLPCIVRNLGDKLVSWIRTKDLHILTSGKFTFTADSRFDVSVSSDWETWTLAIDPFRTADVGKYECQVNTDPKMNKFFNVSIRETPLKDSPSVGEAISLPLKASISGPKEQYVREGYTVAFECRLYGVDHDYYHHRYGGKTLPTVQWLHDGYAVSFQSERGGISIDTEKSDRTALSTLTVASVGLDDAGKYSCGGEGVAADTIHLHVVEGHFGDAPFRSTNDSNAAPSSSSFNYAVLILITLCSLLNVT